MYSNNHSVQFTCFLFSLNISKHCIYLQCVVKIYTKALAHIYNCPCVDLFLLDQCVINVAYVCLSCLKVIGQYATKPTKNRFLAMEHEKSQPTQPTKNGWSQQNTTLAFKVRL